MVIEQSRMTLGPSVATYLARGLINESLTGTLEDDAPLRGGGVDHDRGDRAREAGRALVAPEAEPVFKGR
jgi:hypothetical protein